jgi:CHAT domain-containing protein
MVGRADARPLAARVGLADELSGKAQAEVARVFGPSSQPDRRELRLNALWRVLAPTPVWAELRRASHAVIAPDGALHLLPFDALVVMPRAPGRGVRYWLDDGPATSYAASATSLLSLERRAVPRHRNPAGSAVLSVSDPLFDAGEPPAHGSAPGSAAVTALPRFDPAGKKWKPLPGTRIESERLVRAFAPESVEVLAGPAATEQAVRASLAGKRFIHIATHGFVTETRGDLLAGLVLSRPTESSGTSADDGLLQLYEIYELPLDCDLAVLSACETQRGPRVPGEGVFALSRGFLAAGARGVIASLWAVEDLATAELVAGTFDGIAADYKRGRNSDVALLLRDAKRRVRAHGRWSDPLYWAAFVLTGTR